MLNDCDVRMPYYCTVPQCTSMSGKIKNVSFHQFPRDLELANLWNKILKKGKPYTKYSKVCSLHFRSEDFKGVWKTLKKDAIPSKNLPIASPPRQIFNLPSNDMMIKTQFQQQLAHAIYSQTMLAMQAASLMANASKCDESSGNDDEAKSFKSLTIDTLPFVPNSTQINEKNVEETANIDTNNHNEFDKIIRQLSRTYICSKCSKHYKDYDVYLLHKRSHKHNNEKENIDTNKEILRANPILANLLTPTQDCNISKAESETQKAITTSFTANMKSHLHNLATMMIQNGYNCEEEKDNEGINDNKYILSGRESNLSCDSKNLDQ